MSLETLQHAVSLGALSNAYCNKGAAAYSLIYTCRLATLSIPCATTLTTGYIHLVQCFSIAVTMSRNECCSSLQMGITSRLLVTISSQCVETSNEFRGIQLVQGANMMSLLST